LRHDQYRFRFYFNASHAIYLSGDMGEIHPHTWEVILNVLKITGNFVLFNEIEKMCEGFLSQYQDVIINEIPPFTTVNPTLENICGFFKEEIQKMLQEKGWLLLSIELSETPARAYVISTIDELVTEKPTFDMESEERLQDIVERLADAKITSMSKKASPLYDDEIEREKILKEVEKKITGRGRLLGMFSRPVNRKKH